MSSARVESRASLNHTAMVAETSRSLINNQRSKVIFRNSINSLYPYLQPPITEATVRGPPCPTSVPPQKLVPTQCNCHVPPLPRRPATPALKIERYFYGKLREEQKKRTNSFESTLISKYTKYHENSPYKSNMSALRETAVSLTHEHLTARDRAQTAQRKRENNEHRRAIQAQYQIERNIRDTMIYPRNKSLRVVLT